MIACLFLAGVTGGCSNTISQQLLYSRSGLETAPPVNNLAIPPADVLQTAVPDQNTAFVEETTLPADVPTLTELSSRPVEGIDAPKVGLSIDEDVASKTIKESVRWRGKRNADGVDLANRNGALCSGTERDFSSKNTITVACSDGRVAVLKLKSDSQAQLVFKNGPVEEVLLNN